MTVASHARSTNDETWYEDYVLANGVSAVDNMLGYSVLADPWAANDGFSGDDFRAYLRNSTDPGVVIGDQQGKFVAKLMATMPTT